MKILSHQEAEYISDPEKFDKDYGYVLKHRIKRKVEDMELILGIVRQSGILMSNRERKKAVWSGLVMSAMVNLDTIDEKLREPHYDRYNKELKEAMGRDDYDGMNKALWRYQREIVGLYHGKGALEKELH